MLNINILEYYDIPDKEAIVEIPVTVSGRGKKNIAILMQINKEEVKRRKENEDLQKIIKAIRLTEDDYWLYEADDFTGFTCRSIKFIDSINKILFFGVSPNQLKETFNGGQLAFERYKEADILWIPSMEVLMDEENKMMKAQLWHILQEWFALK